MFSLKNQIIRSDNRTLKKYKKEPIDLSLCEDFIASLPYQLTNDQIKASEEIIEDMNQDSLMYRLLQGDVGSGKTVVSLIALYANYKRGDQGALMAPTDSLARQHYHTARDLFKNTKLRIALLVGSLKQSEKDRIYQDLSDGYIDIVIGTHALFSKGVNYSSLGLVIIDEQHRFGVKQRAKIASKGNNPDVIVMSATPIPRTLALILYGDLDISIIDELPPNRKKIDTFAVGKDMEERINTFIAKQIDEGRQCYIVCPLVEENEEMDLKSVTELSEKLQTEVFSKYKVEFLHGKMKAKEKDDIMLRFKNGEIDILISTTVIEVGVDVPNSNIMVIENAERFGLAQLHQLRGRVGRGEYQSYCILKYNGGSDVVRQRMKIMQDTNNGFVIAEKDLELRGSGEFFGTRQHGIPEFKIANLFEDMPTLQTVQALAIKIIDEDPELMQEKNEPLRKIVDKKFGNRIEI